MRRGEEEVEAREKGSLTRPTAMAWVLSNHRRRRHETSERASSSGAHTTNTPSYRLAALAVSHSRAHLLESTTSPTVEE
jgi:hypothetical protein